MLNILTIFFMEAENDVQNKTQSEENKGGTFYQLMVKIFAC